MLGIWDKISYIVQLLAVCIMIMAPLRKRRYYLIRVFMLSSIFLAVSYGTNTWKGVPEMGIWFFIYWFSYIVACVLFVWLCMDGTVVQAVYCAICSCAIQHIAFDLYLIMEVLFDKNIVLSVFIYLAVYFLFYHYFMKKIPEQGQVVVGKKALFPMVTIILLVWILSLLENSAITGVEAENRYAVIYRIIDGLCCFYVLWGQLNQKENLHLQKELDGINYAWQQQKHQYKVSSETIDSINRKCHDLKKQIHALRYVADEEEKAAYLKELENDIMIYDAALDTGNKALNTVLMEKGLICKDNQIEWSCMADGSRLGFMKLEDIYAIFGNAIDNAIAAVMNLEDSQKRVISVKTISQNDILVIQIQNYYEGEIHFESHLPVTTQKDRKNHGYGIKSIQHTTEKYNGTMTVQTADNIFTLQVLIPVKG